MSKIRKYSITYSNDVYEFLLNSAGSHTIKELTRILSERYNITIENKKLAQYCLKMGIKYKYEHPNKSHSNVSTAYGTLSIKTDGGYVKVKTANHKWEYLQRLIYENEYNVKLPEDVYIIFLDQDRMNFNIKNLKAISRRSSAIMAKDNLFSTIPNITKLGHLNSKLKIKSKEM